MTRRVLFAAICLMLPFVRVQDPKHGASATTRPHVATQSSPSSRPTESMPSAASRRGRLPPVEEPFRSRVERRDLLQRFGNQSPLLGLYQLRAIHRGNATVRTNNGYVWFGYRHMMLQLGVVSQGAESAFMQSSTRQYEVQGDLIVDTDLLVFA